ncbi:MAG: hypothetical protein QM534_12785 [Sediminibacterium sp.]|nr:hypothetical protein [Sediminibacterium sp.]
MRYYFLLCAFGMSTFLALNAQTVTRLLTEVQTKQLITDTCKKRFNINYPVLRVYELQNASYSTYWVLTEHVSNNSTKDTLHDKIKAFELICKNGQWTKNREINDFIEIAGNTERNIWFWTRYCQFEDLNQDGVPDPVIVYGTHGINGFDDGRIKILVFYKGEKTAIRHQNGILDSERNTKIDPSFYQLPSTIQTNVKTLMKKIMAANHGIFPAGWEKAMQNGKTVIDENGH